MATPDAMTRVRRKKEIGSSVERPRKTGKWVRSHLIIVSVYHTAGSITFPSRSTFFEMLTTARDIAAAMFNAV